MALDIKAEIGKVQEHYRTDASKRLSILVYGDMGTGKTKLLETCPRPVFVDMFDPGGETTVSKSIEEGWLVADTRWQTDDPKNPSVFRTWEQEYFRRKREGFFDHFGTYALDSLTTFATRVMWEVLRKANRAGGQPFQQDYLPQMTAIENFIQDVLGSTKCLFVCTAHPDVDKDEATGRLFMGPMVTGKLKVRLPLLFSEIWCAQATESSAGIKYSLLTRQTGLYKARTRIGRDGKFETYEVPDVKALLAKAGRAEQYPDREIDWL